MSTTAFRNPFILDPHTYKRDIRPLYHYFDQAAHLLSIKYQRPYAETMAWLRNNITQRQEPLAQNSMSYYNPRIKYIGKDANGDREVQFSRLSQYLKDSVEHRELIAPTLTTYLHPSVEESHYVEYIDLNVALRNKAKHAMFEAELKMVNEPKYEVDYNVNKNEQANKKINNNSLSGAGAVASTPIYNPTMHSTLTSTCRSTSGYANANNEKLLCGNRHYHRPDIVLNNIVSIVSNTDIEAVKRVCDAFDLHLPTPQETLDVVLYSSRQYWASVSHERVIQETIEQLTPYQRAAFCYVSDLFHLAKFNPAFVKEMIQRLSRKPSTARTDLDTAKVIKSVPEEIANLAIQICRAEMKGLDLKEVHQTHPTYLVATTVLSIQETIHHYADYIQTFLLTKNVPASLSYFPSSIRHSALMSDTDSTIFTTEYWNHWMFGELRFDDEANAVFATMVFFSACTLKHILALMSANFGIVPERLFQIAMKNEFKFDTFVPTLKTKHYYAIISYQEGKVWAKLKQEVKGVHLKASNAPQAIIQEAMQIMQEVCETVQQGKKIVLRDIMQRIADREREVMRSVRAGESSYFRRGQIKSAGSYRGKPTESMYKHYLFWNEIWAPKYGEAQEPPYSYVKLTTTLDSKTKMNTWLAEMKDRDLAFRMASYLKRTNRDKMVSFYVPAELFANKPLPQELIDVVDIRGLISDVCHSFYFILETLGIFRLNSKQTRLISDEILTQETYHALSKRDIEAEHYYEDTFGGGYDDDGDSEE